MEIFFIQGLSPVTALSCSGTVDYMVAAGNQAGLVTIFQIPRDTSADNPKKFNVTPVEAYYERKTKVEYYYIVKINVKMINI